MAAPNLIDRLRNQLPEGPWTQESKDGEGKRRVLAVLMSVVVAFVLWFTFSMRESYSVVIEMPLVIQNLPDGRALSRMPPREARVTVQGDGWDLLKLSRTPPALEVDADEATIDVYRAAAESNRIPQGVAVQSVAPTSVTLDLEPRIVRTLSVRLRADIEAASLYDILAEPSISPDTVVVAGARSIVNALQYWPTERVALEELNETLTEVVALSDTLDGLVSKSLQSVELTVPVALFTEASRELEVRSEGAPPGGDPIRFIPSNVTATYRIPVDQYESSAETEGFYAFVPYANAINDTTGTVQPILHLPESLAVRDVRFEPRRLQYRIRVE
jgi:YbbR domain-containing protein